MPRRTPTCRTRTLRRAAAAHYHRPGGSPTLSTGVDLTSVAGKSPMVERRVPLVVIGAGPAGLAAAMAAAQAGVKVLLVDEHPLDLELMAMDVPLYFGQRMSSAVRDHRSMLERIVRANPALAEALDAGVEVELGTSVWGAFRPGATVREFEQPMLGLADQSRSWLIGYERLVVAAGARDLAIGFRGWQKAGAMGAAAALTLMTRYQALAAERLVILGSGPLGLAVATLAVERGIAVPAVVEIAPEVRGDAAVRDALERRGVRFYPSHAVKEARGSRDEVESVVLAPMDAAGRPVQGRESEIACDTVCVAVGLVPNVELLHLLGCRLVFRSPHGGFVPEVDEWQCTSVPDVFVAGDCAGARESVIANPRSAAAQGRRAGLAAAASLGAVERDRARALVVGTDPAEPDPLLPTHDYWRAWLRAATIGDGADVLACQCEEVTRSDLLGVQPPRYLGWRSAPMSARNLDTMLRDGPLHPDQVKRLTRAGMGACQGRRCREQVALLLADAGGVPVETIPLASYRPPVRPLPLSVLWPEDEPAATRQHWVSWFGIPTQFAPHWVGDAGAPIDDGRAGASRVLSGE
jgi:NADPH-dependent 2,4-dienoyl-CoA reductase/sulfur reductase-like enzyme